MQDNDPFDRIDDEHYKPAFERGIEELRADIAAIRDNPEPPTFENTIEGLMKTGGGRSAFSVLLFQDLAVIPMLAVLPLLALPGARHAVGEHGHSTNWVEGLPGWAAALVVAAAVGVFFERWLFFAEARHLVTLFYGRSL